MHSAASLMLYSTPINSYSGHVPPLIVVYSWDIPSLIDMEYPRNILGITEEYPRNIYAFSRPHLYLKVGGKR
jgi:hypothetical protein